MVFIKFIPKLKIYQNKLSLSKKECLINKTINRTYYKLTS